MRVEQFKIAVVDEHGRPATLCGIRRFKAYKTMADGTLESEANVELRDGKGEPINKLDDGSFVGVLSGRKYFAR